MDLRPSRKAPVGPADLPDPPGPRALRADARLNRDRIVEAARAAYAEHGIDVPVSAIARRAGVGVATLYRRFPTRDALVTEVFAEQLTACAAVLDEALTDPDPWRGFCSVLEKVCAMQVADRGLTEAFRARFPGAVDFERTRSRSERGLAELVRRAQESGQLRPDFAPSDVVLVLLANSGVTRESPAASRAASRRLVAYFLQAFRAEGAEGAGGADGAGGRDGAGGARREAGAHLPPPAPLGLTRVHARPQGRRA